MRLSISNLQDKVYIFKLQYYCSIQFGTEFLHMIRIDKMCLLDKSCNCQRIECYRCPQDTWLDSETRLGSKILGDTRCMLTPPFQNRNLHHISLELPMLLDIYNLLDKSNTH